MNVIKLKDVRRFIIRDSETGNEIVRANTLQEALDILEQFENEDKDNAIYVEGFYEIYDTENEEIINK